MPTREEDLIEANRQGLLTGQMKTDFDAAVSSGLITIPDQAPVQLQDLLIRQARGEEGLQPQITQMRGELNIPDVDRDVSGFQAIQPELPAGTSGISQAINVGGQIAGIPDLGTGLESFARGAQQGLLNVGQGIAGFAGIGGQDLEISRNIERERTRQITEPSPIAGGLGEIAGEVAALPFPAAQTVRGASALGAATGALVGEGTGEDPLQGAILGGVLGAGLKKAENIISSTLTRRSATRDQIRKTLEANIPDINNLGFELKESLVKGTSRVVKNNKLSKLIDQATDEGFDRGILAIATGANKETKTKIRSMLNIARKNIRSPLTRSEIRSSDVLGNSVLKRFNVVQRANTKAGKDIDRAATRFLKKQQFDKNTLRDQISQRLNAEGVIWDGGKSVNVKGSTFEGSGQAQKALNSIVSRFNNTGKDDAFEFHKMKRFIDEQVDFGKTSDKPLSRRSEGIIKGIRRDIDQQLDNISPVYDRANTNFKETIDAITPFNDLIGKKVQKLSDQDKASAIGTLIRRELGNAQSRIPVRAARKELERVSAKHGGRFSDDLESLIAVTNELERIGISKASTSFKEQISSAIPLSKTGAALQAGQAVIKKLSKKEENKALRLFEQIVGVK